MAKNMELADRLQELLSGKTIVKTRVFSEREIMLELDSGERFYVSSSEDLDISVTGDE